MLINNNLKHCRENLEMTQEELAYKLGYKSKSSVTHIEKGRDIPRSMVVKLAQILNTTPSYLMGWVDEDGNEIQKESPGEALVEDLNDLTPDELKQTAKFIQFLKTQRDHSS